MTSKFIEELSGILEVPVDCITDEFRLDSSPAWDSLAFISFIALVDRHFDVIIDGERLINAKNIGELKSFFIKKAA